MTSTQTRLVTINPYQPGRVAIGEWEGSITEIEHAAIQDNPVACYRAGLSIPPQDDETRTLAEMYRAILAEIRRQQSAHDEDVRLKRIAACQGRHKAVRVSEPWGYTGSVAREPFTGENRAAHGAIGVTETCRCGAERAKLINGMHEEVGVWG